MNSLYIYITFTFNNLADAFIQRNLQMRTREAIKTNKRATICKCYDKSQLAQCSTCSKVFIYISYIPYVYIYIYIYMYIYIYSAYKKVFIPLHFFTFCSVAALC